MTAVLHGCMWRHNYLPNTIASTSPHHSKKSLASPGLYCTMGLNHMHVCGMQDTYTNDSITVYSTNAASTRTHIPAHVTSTPAHVHIHQHTYTYTSTRTHTPAHVHQHIHQHTYTYTSTRTHTPAHTHHHPINLSFHNRFGPLVRCWCMRFESKHSYFKDLAHRVKCFKNIAKTMAERHQHLVAYYNNCSPGKSPYCKETDTGVGM